VSSAKRGPFIALLTLPQRRFPDLDDPARLIDEGVVSVNDVPATNPRTRVRRTPSSGYTALAHCAGRSSSPTP
jgi:hypothetical protein